MTVTLGTLELGPLDLSLLASPVADALANLPDVAAHAHTVAIDPDLADTAALASEHGIPPEVSANCVVDPGRGSYLATHSRPRAGARPGPAARFARQRFPRVSRLVPIGGITPVGLPDGWPLLVDSKVTEQPWVLIGSGLRRSKLALPGASLADIPNAVVLENLGIPVG